MTVSCDVLVVGAGAAGSVASLYLAKKGFNVVLLEKQPKVGLHNQEKIDITEDSGLDPIIDELRLPVLERTNKSRWFSTKNSFTLRSRVHDLYFKRGGCDDSFETQVTKSAIDRGANVILGFELKKLNYKDGRIASVDIRGETINPKVVIAADGFGSIVLKDLRIRERKVASLSGYGASFENADFPNKETHVFFDREKSPGGYFFAAKTEKGLGVACVVVDKRLAQRTAKEYYYKFVNETEYLSNMFKEAKITNDFSGMSYAAMLERPMHGNLLLAGDAARTLDPLFGYGMRNSIISGYTAAETAANSLEEDDPLILGQYPRILRRRISDIREGAKMRRAFNRLDNQDIDSIIKSLGELQEKGVDLDRFFEEKRILTLRHALKNIPLLSKLAISYFI